MINYQKFTIPLIVIMMVGGAIGFVMAYNYYPRKNVNINIDGECFELLGPAFEQYKKLEATKEVRVLTHQYNAIENPEAILPIIFSGTEEEVQELSTKYDVKITESKQIGMEMYNTKNYIGKSIIEGTISKSNLIKVISDLANANSASNNTMLANIGLQTNPYITQEERKQISSDANSFMFRGIKEIMENDQNNVKRNDCRSKIHYTETI